MTGELPTMLSDRDAWTGGFYELAMQLGPRDDQRLQSALDGLSRSAGISGPWQAVWEPYGARPASWTVADLTIGQLRGQLQLPRGQDVICAVIAVREDEGDDWLDLCIPLEALSRGDPRVGGFPFEPDDADSLAWRRPIDDWFARLAEEVRRDAGFRLAVIGFEVSGGIRAEKLGSRDEEHPYGLVLPDGTYLPAVS